MTQPIRYDNPRSIAAALHSLGFRAQKRFGQNFMINPGARAKIIDLAEITNRDLVWEIGPGLGALTVDLVKQARRLRVFELDRGYAQYLSQLFADQVNFCLTIGDALRTWLDYRQESPACVVGNLPYNAATGLITDFIGADFLPRMVFTVQREVGRRIMAQPGDADYGSLAVLCQTRCLIRMPLLLKPGSFWPSPGVTSGVLVLSPRPNRPAIGEPRLFDQVLRSLFAARRKTIENNLKASPLAARFGLPVVLEIAQANGLALGARPETVSPDSIAGFSAQLHQCRPTTAGDRLGL